MLYEAEIKQPVNMCECSFHLCMCACWHPPLGNWKTFLPCAFGLCGRRERLIVPLAVRRSCNTYTQWQTAQRQLCTQTKASHRLLGLTDTTAKTLNTLMPTHRGVARGQRVRRMSMDGSVESEPGQRWSSATRTASILVPRSRAENKSGPSFSIWPAALLGPQPENSWLDHILAPEFTNLGRFELQCATFCPEAEGC